MIIRDLNVTCEVFVNTCIGFGLNKNRYGRSDYVMVDKG